MLDMVSGDVHAFRKSPSHVMVSRKGSFLIATRLLSQILSAAAVLAMATPSRAAPVDYLQFIKPLLQSRCYTCRGAVNHESGLQPIESSPQLPYNWGNRDNWIDFQAYLPLGVAPVR